jgi:integrase
MVDVTRNSYSLYKRESGARVIWYVRFWDDESQSYTGGRSTGQTIKPAAHRQVQKWLAEGLPAAQKKDLRATKNRLVAAIAKYLTDSDVIKKGEVHETSEIIKLFYTQVINQEMSSGGRFVDYLYRFWDWNGNYVQDKLERGKHIGKRYVDGCQTKIKMHIEPYFKNTLLCDVSTKSLEDFMRSFPRRTTDPQNGYSASSINLVMKVIKKALKEAVRLDIIPRDASAGIGLLSEDTEERGIPTPAEIAELFRLEWTDERSRIASILGAVSGMRISEVVGLRIEYVNMEKNVILVDRSYSYYEKRLKGTKNEKSRYIYTDTSIIKMLTGLYAKNPYHDSYIFYGLEPNKPMRYDTVEDHLEKMLAFLFGKEVMNSIDTEWRDLAKIIAIKTEIGPEEMIAITSENLDHDRNCIVLSYSYYRGLKKIEMKKFSEKFSFTLDTPTLQRLAALCGRSLNGFILSGAEREVLPDFNSLAPKVVKKLMLSYGEIARRERNVSFHSFRHFFNSTIRGTVSDDILRLQTGHSDEKMTDHYDHMTDDR